MARPCLASLGSVTHREADETVNARTAGLAVFLLVAAACSGSPDTASTTTTTTSATSTTAASTTTTAPAASTTTAHPSTTTTEPQVYPPGAWWDSPVDLTPAATRAVSVSSLTRIGDELWILGGLYNGTFARRSSDGGSTWTDVEIAKPSSSEAVGIVSILAAVDGGYFARGTISTNCRFGPEVGDGYREPGLCRRHRPAVFLSADGDTWRRLEPSSLSPPSGASLLLADVAVTSDGYVAAGTVRGPDWHIRIYKSADGESWTLEREIRGEDGPLTASRLLTDGDSVVLLADEHPCSEPNDNSPGWILGAQWATHGRIYQGSSVAGLELAGPGDHPLAAEPLPVDCTQTTGYDLADVAYPRMTGNVANGVINVLDVPAEDSGSRRWAQLVDGNWVVTTVDGLSGIADDFHRHFIEVEGAVVLFGSRHTRGSIAEPIFGVRMDDGSVSLIVTERPILAQRLAGAVWMDDTLVITGTVLGYPVDLPTGPEDTTAVFVWRSAERVGEPEPTCVLEPGADCTLVTLSEIPGYPDFAGRDLSGIDLAFADLSEAVFDGADLTGARLWNADAEDASFREAVLDQVSLATTHLGNAGGASFVGATLTNARIDDASGADFTGANLKSARIEFSQEPILDGADLQFTSLVKSYDPSVPYEIALRGVHFQYTSVHWSSEAERAGVPLVLTELSDAQIEYASFKGVDLTRIDPTPLDLSKITVWEGSICFDGLPPDNPPIGTCDRSG